MFGVKEHKTGKGLHARFSHRRRFDQNFYNVLNFIKNCGYLVDLCLPSERLCTEHAKIRDKTVHDGLFPHSIFEHNRWQWVCTDATKFPLLVRLETKRVKINQTVFSVTGV